jgi:hypothetical protein
MPPVLNVTRVYVSPAVTVLTALVKRLDPVALVPSHAYTEPLRATLALQYPISKEKLFS